MITVTMEPRRKLVRAVMSEMLTVADVQQFSKAEQGAVRQMGLGSGEFDLLVHTIDDVVQTQDVINAFQSLVVTSELKARRIAIVRSGVLVRMQSRRITLLRADCAVFEHVADADSWLAEVEVVPAV